ncbi:MAG: ISL3 family transposase [Bdellovibrionia bacterium]
MLHKKLSQQLGLPEVEILDLKSGPHGFCLITQKTRSPFEVCTRCATASSSVYDHRTITVKDEPVRQAKVTLKLRKRRYYCHHCRKPFTEYVPGIWPKRRTTQRLREAIMHACNNFSNMSQVRKEFKVSSSFIYKVKYEQLELKNRQLTKELPKQMGIDEHFVRRKFGAPQFMTVLTDLKKRSVRECVFGKTKAGLREGLSHMNGRHRVEWIALDMSDTYRGFCLEHFPNAKLVADKFHVLRVFSGILNRHRIDTTGDVRKNPVRKLLLRNRCNLKYYEKSALDLWLKDHPKIREAYEWKEHFHRFYRIKGYERACRRFEKLMIAMKFSLIPEIKRFQRTCERWKDEILNYFLNPITNAVTEGYNRVASLVKNRAFGYRNVDNYRLSFLNACAF